MYNTFIMSRFSDYDEFLRSQTSQRRRSQEELAEKLKQSRKEFDPWIKEMFVLVKEYCSTILVPRQQYYLTMKKHESLFGEKNFEKELFFLYRLNLIPRDILPGEFDPTSRIAHNHTTPTIITDHDWHFDVSLEFDLALYCADQSGDLTPKLFLRTWGKLPEDESLLLPADLKVTYKTAWRHAYTEIEINGSPHKLQEGLEKTLLLLTPRVLAHLEEVWKLKK